VFESEKGAIAAVVASDREPDPVRVAKAAQVEDATAASTQRAAEITEYQGASIPPTGLPDGVRVIMDRDLNREDVLYFPAGEPRAVLKIRGVDLRRATKAKVARLASAPAG
jgi:prolyl-tRNA editing enzyme YbaK/EbsC (Cys-tRNA(Pro) deacylase)